MATISAFPNLNTYWRVALLTLTILCHVSYTWYWPEAKKWKSRHDCLYVRLKGNVSNMLTRSKTIVLYCKNCLPSNESKFSDSILIKYQSSLSFIDNMPLNEMKVSTALFYLNRKYFPLTLTETSGNPRA